MLSSIDPVVFCKEYLNINASSDSNPKYVLLKNLVQGFLEYQTAFNCRSEIEALRSWATHFRIENMQTDLIGRYSGVGMGVVNNIRLNLGYSVIKPDRHVLRGIKDQLGLDICIEQFDGLASELGYEPRILLIRQDED